MHFHRIALQLIFTICLTCFFSPVTLAQNSPEEIAANKTIHQLYHTLHRLPTANMPARITYISQQFLNKPYLLTPLGEGQQNRFDQFPLYRTDAFDCETYVDTVLALALANNQEQFTKCINKIRYKDGNVSYINRNHFTDLDWNLNNQQQGFLKDITASFHDRDNRSVIKYAHAVINKPAWYQHRTITTIRLTKTNKNEQAKRLEELKKLGQGLPVTISKIAYIPFTALFDKTGNADMYLFKQIPNGAIVEIVRPNWELTHAIGTNLNVSHLGFAIWKKGVLYFREASSLHHRVMEVSLINYLRNAQKSPTIKGINIQLISSHTKCD